MADVEVLTTVLGSPEGPDLLSDGRVVFVETFPGLVSAWDPSEGRHVYAEVGGAPYACMVGLDGVYVTQNGATAGPWRSPNPTTPSIQRVAPDGSVDTVVTEAGGKPLLGPNDLTFGPDGRLYFTDPGLFDDANPEDGRVCVVESDGTTTVLVECGPTYPNGIVAQRDGSIVWTESFTRRLRRRSPDGEVQTVATLPENRVPDGLKIAANGDFYVAGVTSGGIDVVTSEGEHAGFVETGGQPLNLCFGGSALYIADYGLPEETGDELSPEVGRLLRVDVGVEGQPLFRGAVAA